MSETIQLEPEVKTTNEIRKEERKLARNTFGNLKEKFRKWLVKTTVQCTIAYVALAPCVGLPLYGLMLFHPDRTQNDLSSVFGQIKQMFGVSKKDVYFNSSNGVMLHGYYFSLPGSKKTVIVSHGNGGNIDSRMVLAACLLKCGVSVFMYDYRGYGLSNGNPTIQGVCDDGVAAYDFIAHSAKVAPRDILLYGESLGSGIVCETLKTRQAGGVILESGFDSLLSVAREKVFWLNAYPRELFLQPFLDNNSILAGEHPPLLILHGMKDGLITPDHALALYDNASSPKKLVMLARAGHADLAVCDLRNYFGSLKQFIDSLS